MNERIRELAKKSCMTQYVAAQNKYLERFAELIVLECVGLCDQAAEENKRVYDTVNETGELGPALVTMGGRAQAEKLSKQIKQHFGVE